MSRCSRWSGWLGGNIYQYSVSATFSWVVRRAGGQVVRAVKVFMMARVVQVVQTAPVVAMVQVIWLVRMVQVVR